MRGGGAVPTESDEATLVFEAPGRAKPRLAFTRQPGSMAFAVAMQWTKRRSGPAVQVFPLPAAGAADLQAFLVGSIRAGLDADLLAACARFQAVDRDVRRRYGGGGATDEELYGATFQWDAARNEVAVRVARTAAGLVAKATATMTAFKMVDQSTQADCDRHEWLAYRLAEDLVAWGRGREAMPAAASPAH